MRILITVMTILLVILLAGSLAAEVKITGDARVRPRMDLKDYAEFGNQSSNGYYYYRARLNFKSELGEGWFGHIQLGTNGFGYFTGKFGDPTASDASKPSSTSIDGASRGPVDFMLVYFGRKTKSFGYMGGLMTVDGINNPMYDIHYYSDNMVDVPYYLYSNNGAHGFSGYIGLNNGGKINATIYVDNNDGVKIENSDGDVTKDVVDQYTVMLDAPLKFADFTVQPVILFTAIAQDSLESPISFGLNVTTPQIGKIKLGASFSVSSQNEDGTVEYDAWLARAKVTGQLGTGNLTAWYDIAKKTEKLLIGDRVHDFGYLWLSYSLPVFKNENGSVSIKPTWRHVSKKIELDGVKTKDFSRDMIELTIDFQFK